MLYILLAVLSAILIVTVSFVLRRKNMNMLSSLPPVEKADVVTLKEVISFFKQPEVLDLLKQSEDRIAVAIRQKQKSGKYQMILCIFSKKTSSIIRPLKVIETPVLDQELLGLFGEKDMLVLQ